MSYLNIYILGNFLFLLTYHLLIFFIIFHRSKFKIFQSFDILVLIFIIPIITQLCLCFTYINNCLTINQTYKR